MTCIDDYDQESSTYKGMRKEQGFRRRREGRRLSAKRSTLTNARKVAEASCCLEHDTDDENGAMRRGSW